jgi:hypothetical protein
MLPCLLVGGVGVSRRRVRKSKQGRRMYDGVCAGCEETMEMLTLLVDVPGETNGRLELCY